MASSLEGIPWNARGRIGQERLRRPEYCRGRSGMGRLVLVSVFLPWLFESNQREPLTDWLSNLEIESCGCDSFEASKWSAVFPAIRNE